MPKSRPMIVLITGPVRSGKSTRATHLAREFGLPVSYVVTARVDPNDREMAARIERHRLERGAEPAIELWQPGGLDLPAIVGGAPARTTLLVDSIGTWLAGHLLDMEALAEHDAAAAAERLEAFAEPLLTQLAAARAHVVLVGEETGWGLVPPTAQGRVFRDALGRVSRRVARAADRCELVVAGYAIDLHRCGVAIF
jgi:adenosylcobinamide kinase/adenosylcobinamide-phosphate guanylyltransferase